MTLHVETTGAGPDVVLLHGWSMHGGIWGELACALAARCRVHAVDLPGHGASPVCKPFTLEEIASELASQLPAPCAVCGWSLGGQAALAWARGAPHQVKRLALIATTPCFARRDDWPHAVQARVLHDFAREFAADYGGTLKRFLALQARGDAQAGLVMRRLRKRFLARGQPGTQALQQGLEILLGTDLRSQLHAITQPTLVVHGDRDALTPLAAGEYLSRTLPNARLAVVHGAAHAPFVGYAGKVGALLVDFFDGR
jgi:pimeloyl-[acyl-carrier protein] methyl ester esterase